MFIKYEAEDHTSKGKVKGGERRGDAPPNENSWIRVRCFLTPKIVAKFQQLWTAVGQDEPVNGKERSGEW